jgi:N-acyl-D-aspartate/D-glutamate deacylase
MLDLVSLGPPIASAARTIDAAGRAVAPGFVDPHTHFDAQLCWDPQAHPSLEHGVTTVVPGNCSLPLAPLRREQSARFSRMFRQIEEMPEAAFDDGIDWRWASASRPSSRHSRAASPSTWRRSWGTARSAST